MKTIGIKLADGSFSPVLQEGQPGEATLELTTAHNNQTRVMVDLYRTETGTMDEAEYVGTLQIDNLNERAAEDADISLVVSIDENDKLSARILDKDTGASNDIAISLVNRIPETPEPEIDDMQIDIDEVPAGDDDISGEGLLAAANKVNEADESDEIMPDEPTAADFAFDEILSDGTDDGNPFDEALPETTIDTEPAEQPVEPIDESNDLPDFDDLDFGSTDDIGDIDIGDINTESSMDDADFSFEQIEDTSSIAIEGTTDSSELNFNGLFDDDETKSKEKKPKEKKPKEKKSKEKPKKKKSKAPVVICIICAIICIIAVILILFVVPSKFNISSLLKKDNSQTVKIEKAEPAPVPVQAAELEPEPEPEPIPEPEPEPEIPSAEEDEIIIIEKAEEVKPEPPAPPEPEKKPDIAYKVKWGDTLWDIANTYYKNPWRYTKIAKYNGIKDPDCIVSGTIILIPQE